MDRLEREIRELQAEMDNIRRQLRIVLPGDPGGAGKFLMSGSVESEWSESSVTKAQVEAVLVGEINSHSHAGVGSLSEPALTALLDDNYAALSHSHGDLYYTESETDALLATKAAAAHSHGDLYYTESESDALLAGKSDTSHLHDDRYYTESETDSLLSAKAATSHNHSASDIDSGTLADARVAASNVLQHQGSLSLTESQISDLGAYITGIDKAAVEAVLTGVISSHSHAGGSSFDSTPGVVMASGTTTITNADTTVALDTEEEDPSGNYALALNEVTVTTGGWMFLSYSIPVNDGGSAGGTRARVYAWVEADTGGGYSAIAQSRAQDYAREASGGEGLGTGFVANIPAGAKVRLRIRQSGTTALNTESGETQLSMFRLST